MGNFFFLAEEKFGFFFGSCRSEQGRGMRDTQRNPGGRFCSCGRAICLLLLSVGRFRLASRLDTRTWPRSDRYIRRHRETHTHPPTLSDEPLARSRVSISRCTRGPAVARGGGKKRPVRSGAYLVTCVSPNALSRRRLYF